MLAAATRAPAGTSAPLASTGSGPEVPQPASVAGTRRTPAPRTIVIPSIGVAAKVAPLDVTDRGELLAPTDFGKVGWWPAGATVGEPGPAVLVGHVDNKTGPAVFFRLKEVRPGDEVQITRSDGMRVVYVVERLASAPKGNFPTLEVYGPTEARTLRLITCAGRFDRRQGAYTENLIVYAQQVA